MMSKIKDFYANSSLKVRVEWLKSKLRPYTSKYVAWRKKRPTLSRVLEIVSGLFFAGLFSLLIFIGMIHKGVFGKLPTYGDLRAINYNQAAEVFSVDSVLLGKYFIENRLVASQSEVSPAIINALVATEDARFFEHSGVDFRAILRVFVKTILGGDDSAGGGSTISQQLAKNLFPREDWSILSMPVAKVKEIMIARRLEKLYSKDELLNVYLNTVPFAENIFGIKVAAQRFFNTSTQDIKVEQAAVLVGMLKATSSYNPVNNPEKAKDRRNVVMTQMVKYNYLDKTLADSLSQLPIVLEYYKEGNNQGVATYFREHLRLELKDFVKKFKKSNGDEYNLYTDGLRIYTTIDSKIQKYAEEAVNTNMQSLQAKFDKHVIKYDTILKPEIIEANVKVSPRYEKYKKQGLSKKEIDERMRKAIPMTVFMWNEEFQKDTIMSPYDSVRYYLSLLSSGLIAVDQKNGEVKAWVGGINHKFLKFDNITARRQVGSTFKPIVYAAALRAGISPCTHFHDYKATYSEYEDWAPANSDDKYGGYYSMQGAIAKSKNTISAALIMKAGIENVQTMAKDLGVTSKLPNAPSIALGTGEISLLDMMQVYTTFANEGIKTPISYLLKIESSKGKTIWEREKLNPKSLPQVLTKREAQIMYKFLRAVVAYGTARGVARYNLPYEVCGKTGTTQNQSDGWFIGYHPSLTAGVWVGGQTPAIRFQTLDEGQGSTTALPIWGTFMSSLNKDKAFAKYKKGYFTAPDSLVLDELDCPTFIHTMQPELDSTETEVLDQVMDALLPGKAKQEVKPETPKAKED